MTLLSGGATLGRSRPPQGNAYSSSSIVTRPETRYHPLGRALPVAALGAGAAAPLERPILSRVAAIWTTGQLADRDYRFYVFGNLASSIGVWAQRVGIGWTTWELTHSATLLGLMSFAETGPSILLGLFAGSVLDRVDQLKALRISQSLSLAYAVALAACAFAGVLDAWLLFALVCVRGAIFTFNRVGRQTVVYALVPRDQLAGAIALNSTIQNTSRFIGPTVGGLLLSVAGAPWTFVAAAGLFAIFTAALRRIRIEAAPKATAGPPPPVWRQLGEGLAYVASHPGLRAQFLILTVVALSASPLTDLFPSASARIFARGSAGLATLLTCHGVGATLGGLWLSARASPRGLTALSLMNILLLAGALAVFALSELFWLACAAAFVAGFGAVVQNITNQTLVQSAVDAAFRGRVMGFYGAIAQGVSPIGTLMLGRAADAFGLRAPLLVASAACLIVWAIAWRRKSALAQALKRDNAY